MNAENNYLEVAAAMVDCARSKDYIDGPLAVIPELADKEKELFMLMFDRIGKHLGREKKSELSGEEIISLFTFVFARAGEAVVNWHSGQENEFYTDGMFDGKVPIYTDHRLLQYFKTLNVPGELATAFGEWNAANPEFCAEHQVEPLIILFEALKWTWRIAVNVTVNYLEANTE